MHNMIGVVVFSALAVACAGDRFFAEDHRYSTNRELYTFPAAAAMARADALYTIDVSPFVNPGALAMGSRNALNAAYAGFYSNAFSTSSLSYRTTVFKWGAVGFSAAYLLIPHIPITNNWQKDASGYPVNDSALTRFASASEIFVRAAWAMEAVSWQWGVCYIGAAVNALRRNLVGIYGHGIAADAGTIVHIPRAGVGIGLQAENILGSYLDWAASTYYDFSLPRIKIAVTAQKEIPYVYGKIKVCYTSLDLLSNEGINALEGNGDVPGVVRASQDPLAFIGNGRIGAEYLILDQVSLRVGTSPMNRLAFGGGVSLFGQTLLLDFAYIFHEIAGTYQLGLGYLW